jgi:hypothetical protein
MEHTECSETSAYKIQTPGELPRRKYATYRTRRKFGIKNFRTWAQNRTDGRTDGRTNGVKQQFRTKIYTAENTGVKVIVKVKVKVKQSHYRPGQALRAPEC